MRINATGHPDVQTETTPVMGSEEKREEVFLAGNYVGAIVYRRRRVAVGSEYGWQREKAAKQSKLLTNHDAIADLLRVAAERSASKVAR